jgi:hypothetical protein
VSAEAREKHSGMSIAVIIGVHDGVVLAADSASTLMVMGAPQPMAPGAPSPAVVGRGVLNVYDNANKIFNLYKGHPVGCITFGSGSIGNASISTLLKDLRAKLTNRELNFNPDQYTIKQVAEILSQFLNEECSKLPDQATLRGVNVGFLLGGYSSGEPLGESWSVEIKNGLAGDPLELRKKHESGLSWGGMGEVLSRIVLGYSPQLFQVLSQATSGPEGPVSADQLQKTLGPVLSRSLQAQIVFAPMPIQDAIDLARFLVHSAVMFSRFTPGHQTVGGMVEIAAITKHEGFKWISRKHYYDQKLNKEAMHVISD